MPHTVHDLILALARIAAAGDGDLVVQLALADGRVVPVTSLAVTDGFDASVLVRA